MVVGEIFLFNKAGHTKIGIFLINACKFVNIFDADRARNLDGGVEDVLVYEELVPQSIASLRPFLVLLEVRRTIPA